MSILTLCFILSASACGGNAGGGTVIGGDPSYDGPTTEIEIWLWESGYGKDYLENIASAFVKKYPQYTVRLEATADSTFLENKLPLNAELNTADILMSIKGGESSMRSYCEPLNDVYNYVNKGETKTIAEKLGSSLTDSLVYADDKYYYTPYVGGFTGLTYNEDILKDYYVPHTTDELISLVGELTQDEIVPFIHFIGGGYWAEMFYMWMAQYYGLESMKDINRNPTLEKVISEENGVYESLKVLEGCLNSPKKYYSGSNAMNFTDAQTLYIEGSAAMMANGTWMEYEMSENYAPGTKNFKMMKTPVISSIINKCSSIADDDELSYLVKAIDAGKTALVGTGYEVSQADFDRVKEARNIMYNHAIGHAACIPKYSDNIVGAKEFLKFYYSDEALKIFADTTSAKHICNFDGNVQLDTSSWSAWQKNQLEIDKDCETFVEGGNRVSALYTTGGLTVYAGIEYITRLSTNNDADKLTAAEIWQNIKNYHNENWNRYLINSGM